MAFPQGGSYPRARAHAPLPAVEAACQEALREGVHWSDAVINILARKRDPAPVATIMTPDALRLRHAPVVGCTRYDSLRRAV